MLAVVPARPIDVIGSSVKSVHMKPLLRTFAAILFISLVVAPPLSAQQHRAAIRGEVVDASLAPLANVEVRVTREATNDERVARTDERGRFTVPELPSGTYRLDVRQSGFGPFVARAELAMNEEFWLRVPLQVGDVLQAVDVTAPFMPVDRYSPALHTFIDDRQVTGLPLDGRNFLELALLAPGAAPAPQGSASSSRGDFALSVNGAREDFNGFLLDGVYNIDPKLNTPGVRPPVDAIREFQVHTSTYDASFGRNAGGQINVITKSGNEHDLGVGVRVLPQRRARLAQPLRAGATSRRPTTAATSSAARSAAPSCAIARSSLPTTSARICARG